MSARIRGIREIRGQSSSDNLAAAMRAFWGTMENASIRRLRTPTPPPRPEAEVWPFLSPPSRKRKRLFVRRLPKGDLRIAHAFKRGTMELGASSPEGTAESLSPNDMACQQTNNNRRVQPSLRDLGNGECEPGSELPGYSRISLREMATERPVLIE